MAFKIGFATETTEKTFTEAVPSAPTETIVLRKSVVQAHFPTRNMTLAYYNNQFDLHRGDLVYVDGKLEGLRGRVTDVSYNFKIKVSDYKRVIAAVDTNVHGRFHMAVSHFVTFDDEALPHEKVALWFRAPQNDDEEIACGSDDSTFLLDDLKAMDVSPSVAERGHDYYMDNRVRYLSIDFQ